MDDWQCEHIIKNLPKLASNTIFNIDVQAELRAKNVLSKSEIEKLNAEINLNGNSKASHLCYEWLMGRTDAYKILTKALIQSQQTGSARILIEGVPTELFRKPLTYLGISTELKQFQNVEIEVHEKVFKVSEFFPNSNYKVLQQIFQDTLSELEVHETFIMKQKIFVLAKNTVPPKPSYYVPRFLSNRIKLNETIFKSDCPDVFVFKNTIARYKLSQIASPHFTADSTSQLTKITCRFIHLDDTEDWTELKKVAKVPIHLINYEVDENIFLLEYTSVSSDILQKFRSQKQQVYVSEEEFVQQQLSDYSKTSNVCICDSPGKGKSYLLANIARQMTNISPGKIIAYESLNTFVTNFVPAFPDTTFNHETALLNVLKCISSSNTLLLKLVQVKLVRLEIFFDGFDEIPSKKVKWTRHIFISITTNFPNVKMYITSRHHMRQQLEESVGVVAYDILPLNQQNQVDFLVQFWQNSELSSNLSSLQKYATTCLKTVNSSLTQNDLEITGIPLLCQLIAEVFADKVAFRSIEKGRFVDVPLQISGMYQKYIEKKTYLVARNKNEFYDIKLVHVRHALKLLFPTNCFHEDNSFRNVIDLLESPKILVIGILQKHSNASLEFIHRTFAEYLVAEYFSTKLQDEEMQKNEEINSNLILKVLLKSQNTTWANGFVHPVIVSFFNSDLGKVNISKELKIKGAVFISSILNKDFISILSACCHNNFLAIFSVLGEVLIESDNSWVTECFTDENTHKLLEACISFSSSQMFHKCIQLLTEILKLDLERMNTFDKSWTLLQTAVGCANYEAVEYFVDRISLKNQSLLPTCIVNIENIAKAENILNLLLNKDPNLIHETPDLFQDFDINLRLFKILVRFGANLTAIDSDGNNCAMYAAKYMPPNDFHELVQFLLIERKSEHLFLENEKWKYPLPTIVQWATLLPETLELLLNISSNDISIKCKRGENLLFSAVRGNKVISCQQLINRKIDYNTRGWNNRSLLHVASKGRKVETVSYLLSLKLDPNSRDENGRTPLYYALNNTYEIQSIVKVLVENGANVHAKYIRGQTALHLLASRSSDYWVSKDVEVMKYLIGKGARVNDRDIDGNTPLHLCENDWNIKQLLIEMGADTHAKNNKGQTPPKMNPHLWKVFN